MQIVAVGQTRAFGDGQAIGAALRFIAESQPDRVVFVRSVNDGLIASLREVFTGSIGVHRCSDAAVTRFGVELLPRVSEFAPGWATALRTAEEGDFLPSFALNTAKKAGISLVMGATQSMSVFSHSIMGDGGEVLSSVTGIEVGHLLQPRKTLGGQQGFVVLDVDGESVAPSYVMITDGKCTRTAATSRDRIRTVDPRRSLDSPPRESTRIGANS